ncbi:uncharacterized protein LOC132620030 [Lycium barbarum]|uniref:uncharacterized protein LOC132620030 n=1 Tax=Lycium barbarum TaxID=112863 RepID=UPI00293E4095|nr:uncharacterized protein LOC132620030 [Lycium barbarum]
MSTRSTGYSTNEDMVLCQVYLDVSQDPITGINQSRDNFWGRMEDGYNSAKDEYWEYRNKRSLECRIKVIEKAIRKLNGCVRQVENLHPSGASDKDIINQAKCLLMQDPNYKKDFKFDHVWDMMKDFEKFKDVDVGSKNVRKQGSSYISSESETPTPDSPLVSSPNLSSFSLNLNEDVAGDSTSSQRPIGVKKAKLERKIEEGFSSAMQMVQSENNRLVELLAKSGADRQGDLEMKDRALKLKEFKEENKILLSNLDSIGDPNIREFIRQEQKRIMDKKKDLVSHLEDPGPSSILEQAAITLLLCCYTAEISISLQL